HWPKLRFAVVKYFQTTPQKVVDGPCSSAVQEQQPQPYAVHDQVGPKGHKRTPLAKDEHREIRQQKAQSRCQADQTECGCADGTPKPDLQLGRCIVVEQNVLKTSQLVRELLHRPE